MILSVDIHHDPNLPHRGLSLASRTTTWTLSCGRPARARPVGGNLQWRATNLRQDPQLVVRVRGAGLVPEPTARLTTPFSDHLSQLARSRPPIGHVNDGFKDLAHCLLATERGDSRCEAREIPEEHRPRARCQSADDTRSGVRCGPHASALLATQTSQAGADDMQRTTARFGQLNADSHIKRAPDVTQLVES
jgi:hypothetical protein